MPFTNTYKNTTNKNRASTKRTSRTDVNDPAFNNTFKSSDIITNGFDANLHKWVDFVSFCRWSPDLFFDLITPETGGIRLDLDQRVFLRCMARFISNYAVFPRGYGKCVQGDTIIFTENGLKEIGSYFDYDNSGVERFIESEIRLLNRYGKIENTNAGVYSGYKPIKRIRTEEGYGVGATHNHPLLVMRDGILDWVKSDGIRIGDFMPISRGQNVWGKNVALDTDVEAYFKSLNLSKQSYSGVMRAKCNTPTELTEKMALVIGYLIGDGTLTRDNMIGFTNIDQDIIDNYTSFMNEVIGLRVGHTEGNINYSVSGRYVREYFRQIGLAQSNALGKEVPKCILEAPKNMVSSFIRGLFDTDGGLSNSYIQYATSSEKLSKQVQVILSNFGIVSTRKVYQTKCMPTYKIMIYSKNMDIYLKEIGFSCKRKQDRLIELCKKTRNMNKDIIPSQKDLVVKFYNSYKRFDKGPLFHLGSGKPRYLVDALYHVLNGKNDLTYDKLDCILSLPSADECDGYNELLEIRNSNYFYSKVQSIEDSEDHVYDLSVPETHSFVSNGLISHNTMLEVMSMIHTAIFFPYISLAMTAQTKENAVEILEEKYNEIMHFYPLLLNEIEGKPQFSKNDASILFRSGSKIDILANSQSSKGQRRKRINIEESALLNDSVFQDALAPTVIVGRRTIGKIGGINPEELNGQINFLTTSGWRGSTEFDRNLQMIDEMADLKGKMVLGSSWELAATFKRTDKYDVLAIKDDPNTSPTFFDHNYMSYWTGSSDGAVVKINDLMDLRVIKKAELEGDGKSEYFLGMDVARSESKSNNQSSIAVGKLKRNKDGRINKIYIVNIINLPNGLTYTAQTVILKRTKAKYNASMIVIDANGTGQGIVDECLKDTIDTVTGESLGCWDTVNTEAIPDVDDAEVCLFALKATGINSNIIYTFQDMVESKKLQLLIQKSENKSTQYTEDELQNDVLPFVQTDKLIEEVANLKLKQLPSGLHTVERLTRKVDKDRYSAVSYLCYYLKTNEDYITNPDDDEESQYFFAN